MNWLRKLLGLHVHEWGAPVDIHIPPATYEAVRDPRITVRMLGRDFQVRWCTCGKYKRI